MAGRSFMQTRQRKMSPGLIHADLLHIWTQTQTVWQTNFDTADSIPELLLIPYMRRSSCRVGTSRRFGGAEPAASCGGVGSLGTFNIRLSLDVAVSVAKVRPFPATCAICPVRTSSANICAKQFIIHINSLTCASIVSRLQSGHEEQLAAHLSMHGLQKRWLQEATSLLCQPNQENVQQHGIKCSIKLCISPAMLMPA